jgi:hypothetical protein
VQKFSDSGAFITSIINAGEGPNGVKVFPKNLAVDTFDNVYVTDAISNQVFVFKPNKYLTAIHSR